MKLIFLLAFLVTLAGCANIETWDAWDSTPTDGFWSITPSVDATRTPDGKYYISGCVTSRVLNLCDAAQSSLNDQ